MNTQGNVHKEKPYTNTEWKDMFSKHSQGTVFNSMYNIGEMEG